MAMKRCPVCGEKYSDTYRSCPFCEEDAMQDRRQSAHRRGGSRTARRGGRHEDPGILTPVLVVVIVVLSMTLVWLFFGEQIKDRFFPGGGPAQSAVSSQVQSGASSSPSFDTPSLDEPDTPDVSGEPQTPAGELTVEQVAQLPNTLTLSKTDFTIPVGDPAVKLTVSGGSGSYTWYSEDDGVASVDENGIVTPISAGTINVYATDGTARGQCIVRVKAGKTAAPAAPSDGGTDVTVSTPSGGTVSLNREDFTLAVGESFQLKYTGITTAPTWSSSDPSVATVNASGVVTGVARGMTTVTLSYDGSTLKCIVRVK